MAVKPYWWCVECSASHDAAVKACQSCRGRVVRRMMRVPSAERDDNAEEGEWRTLIWDMVKLKETGKKEEKAGLPNHCCDATLYAWRECYWHPGADSSTYPGIPRSPDIGSIADPKVYGQAWRTEQGPGIGAKIGPTPPQKRRLQTTCWAPYDMWDSLEDA